MALKGKTTIQLFDATTGEEVLNVEDENMVTDAVSSLCNNASKYFVQNVFGAEYEFDFVALTGKLIDSMFSGLMLFDENIPENKNTFFAPPNATLVGKAKKLTNTADRFTGVLNETETVTLDNGKKYVWDFATNKANEQIKSVCLTSAAGGYCGTYCEPKTDFSEAIGSMYPIQAPRVTNSGNSKVGDYYYRYYKLIGSFKDTSNSFPASDYATQYSELCNLKNKNAYLIGVNSDGNFVYAMTTVGSNSVAISVYDYKKEKSRTFGLNANSYSGKYSEDLLNSVTLTSDVATFSSPLYWKTIEQNTYSIYIDSNKKLNVIVVNLDTLTITKQVCDTVQDAVLGANLQINGTDGQYIYTVNTDSSKNSDGKYKGISLYKINIDDFSDYELIQITEPFEKAGSGATSGEMYIPFYAKSINYLKSVHQNASQLLIGVNANMYYYSGRSATTNGIFYIALNIKDGTCEYFGEYSRVSNYSGGMIYNILTFGPLNPIQAPDCPICLGHKSDTNIYYTLPMMFLSTINNLSQPVVKNETQTMKVTYEITEV
ncbi:hypothetical protein SAMN04515656_10350 [Eubacterium aggregans]|uniref:Uncharacterized protein n=1 Tax=Eubacterium aggregans TaxID=81409 RepID=A0A1H3Y3L7_9FIRM|nr:hypothetical protein [Eubacterium aggregans]SEA06206.1 hypothetical protein SAMN04515656_10350 [Eubacterium aggregans]